jgi:hypothetical protein
MANRFIIEIRTKGFSAANKDFDKLNAQTRTFVGRANKSGKATAKLRAGFSKLRNDILLATFAFGALIAAVNKTVAAYKKQVEAETRLRASLRNVSTASKDGADKLINLAAALQKVTTFGDEQIIAGQAMLATFQLNEDAIAALTPRMLDMAAAMGTGGDGLTSIALQLGKAFTGQVGALSRSGVLVDNLGVQMARAKGPTEEFSFLIEQLDNNFKGLAQELASTTLGQIDQMENKISDLNEEIGRTALPLKGFMAETKLFVTQQLATWAIFVEEFQKMGTNVDVVTRWEAAWERATNRAIENEKNLKFAAGKTNMTLEQRRKILSDENALDILGKQNAFLKDDGVLSFNEKLLILKAQLGQNEALFNEGLSTKIEFSKKDLELQNKILQLTHAKNHAELKAAADLLSNLGRLSGANRSFAIAAARLSQASAIIDTYAGANKALAQGGVLGFLTGASVIAAGLANVAEIENQLAQMQRAKHGADFITSGPQLMMVGEGSGPEHVQVRPLVDSNIDGPQGGGVTVNIMGGVVHDDYIRNELIPALNKAVSLGAEINA